MSWLPDPDSCAVDAFTVKWSNHFFYAFPPFCLVLRTLNKIIQDKAQGIVIVPKWESQPWYPLFQKLLIKEPIIIDAKSKPLNFPFRSQVNQFTLVAGILSGNRLEEQGTLKRQSPC